MPEWWQSDIPLTKVMAVAAVLLAIIALILAKRTKPPANIGRMEGKKRQQKKEERSGE